MRVLLTVYQWWSAPKSPDHSDVNKSSIATQTHQEAHRSKTNGDVWHSTRPPETSVGSFEPPPRFDTGADSLLHHFTALKKLSMKALLA